MLPTTKLDFSLEFRSPITRRQRTGTNGFSARRPLSFHTRPKHRPILDGLKDQTSFMLVGSDGFPDETSLSSCHVIAESG
jgi:hypothetical protein